MSGTGPPNQSHFDVLSAINSVYVRARTREGRKRINIIMYVVQYKLQCSTVVQRHPINDDPKGYTLNETDE